MINILLRVGLAEEEGTHNYVCSSRHYDCGDGHCDEVPEGRDGEG